MPSSRFQSLHADALDYIAGGAGEVGAGLSPSAVQDQIQKQLGIKPTGFHHAMFVTNLSDALHTDGNIPNTPAANPGTGNVGHATTPMVGTLPTASHFQPMAPIAQAHAMPMQPTYGYAPQMQPMQMQPAAYYPQQVGQPYLGPQQFVPQGMLAPQFAQAQYAQPQYMPQQEPPPGSRAVAILASVAGVMNTFMHQGNGNDRGYSRGRDRDRDDGPSFRNNDGPSFHHNGGGGGGGGGSNDSEIGPSGMPAWAERAFNNT